MKSVSRRNALAIAATAVVARPAFAQTPRLPDGPLKIVAGFAAGGSGDILARLVGAELEKSLGRAVIIENKPGAGGRTAAQEIARAKPDGATILVANIVNAVLIPLTFSDARYHPLTDFTLLGRGADFQIAFATGPLTGAKDLKSLLAWLKGNPDKAVYAVPGAGSIPHLYALELAKAAGLDMRMLQARGGAPVANDLLTSTIPLGIAGTGDFAELHRAGKIRIVAVSGTRRAPGFDDVPTCSEQGFAGFESNGWIAFFAPPGMAKDTQNALSDMIGNALVSPFVRDRLTLLGMVATPSTPEGLQAQIESDIRKWQPLIDASGVKR